MGREDRMNNMERMQTRSVAHEMAPIASRSRAAGPSRRGRVAGDTDPGLSVASRISEI